MAGPEDSNQSQQFVDLNVEGANVPIPTGAEGLVPEAPAAPEATPVPVPHPDLPDAGKFLFEDYFPPIKLTADEEEGLASWFDRDLKKCVREVRKKMTSWSMYRAVYMLEYIEKFYPGNEYSADFPSGLLLEKMIEGMDRFKKAVFKAFPLFAVDDKVTGTEDIKFIHRAQWYMHTRLTRDLKLQNLLYPEGVFDFLLDGSSIVEADQMYEKVPQRVIRTYFSTEDLLVDKSKLVDDSDFERGMLEIEEDGKTRVLVEHEVLTKEGLDFFLVDKVDHLIPPGVYRDEDVRFRARRMYLTRSDLELLSSSGANWYPKAKVDEVFQQRERLRMNYQRGMAGDDSASAMERLAADDHGELAYEWRNQESLKAEGQPYDDTWAVYRILAKFAYKTSSDKSGVIPKFCLFDYEPESRTILRARTYPHFHEMPPYFHFRLGHAPKSYYGLGYGARLIKDDFMAANAVDLYFDAAAMATFKPYVTLDPEEGGSVPFWDGIAPNKVGFVKTIGEFQEFNTSAPPVALIQHILPIVQTRSENKTSVTSLVQGRTESSDPRSPAQKTELLLNEALVGLEAQIDDFNRTWEQIPSFIWKADYERAIYQGVDILKDLIYFPGLAPDLEQTNTITVEELERNLTWVSQASAVNTNDQAREQQFLQRFQFFSPMIQALAQVNPGLYMRYFMRWMNWAAYEMRLRGAGYLVPTAEEMQDLTPEQAVAISQAVRDQLISGQLQAGNVAPEMPEAEGGMVP